MLNGDKNNFGLDLDVNDKKLSAEEYRSYAWSSDVDSFINVDDKEVFIHRWNRQGEERYNKGVVFQNIEKFYNYLEHTALKKENAIVPYAIRTFRGLRNYLREKDSGELSLQAFLYLLAVAEEKTLSFDLETWGLNNEARLVSEVLPIERFLDEFLSGLNHSKLRPDIDLVLRHSAGKLFQEAHYEAILTGQLTIGGTTSPSIQTKIPKYSSVHFTPSYIARSVVEESLNSFSDLPKSIRVFDPACGSGEFLKETLRQLKNRNYQGKVNVIGWDISQPAIIMASFLLSFEKREWGNNLTIELKQVDNSLTEEWSKNIDLMLMNPPFISWNQMTDSERRIVADTMNTSYSSKPNIAAAFLKKAIDSLQSKSVIGCVIPSAILNGDSYLQFRNKISDVVNVRLLAKLGNYVFQSSFIDSSLLIASKGLLYNQETKMIWTYNTSNSAPEALRSLRKQKFDNKTIFVKKDYSIYNINEINDNWYPMRYESWELKTHLTHVTKTGKIKEAKSIFDIRLGARIGNPIFLIDAHIFNSFSLKEKEYFRPVIVNKAIKLGKLSTVSYLFYPNSEGTQTIDSEIELIKRAPNYYRNFLLPNKKVLLNREGINENNWWTLSRDRSWQRGMFPKLISTEFGNAGSFAFDVEGDFVVERGLAWLPKQSVKFTDATYLAYLALFSCSFSNDLFSIYSKQIAGGEWWDLSKRYVQNIPIPDFTLDSVFSTGEFIELAKYGHKLSIGEEIEDNDLLSLVKSLYDLD